MTGRISRSGHGRAVSVIALAAAGVLSILFLSPSAALADGGAGGIGFNGCASQGTGGPGYDGESGTDADSLSFCSVGGGGGGGAGGGSGGAGGSATNSYTTTIGGTGGAGGTALSPDGRDGNPGEDTGGNYYIPSGGGGGGGGYNGNGNGAATLDNVSPLTGGDGGKGGTGGSSNFLAGGGGGGGGAGGYGAVVTGDGASTNIASITGGKGGDGGTGGNAGSGGDGGIGAFFTTSGAALTNSGTITGGDGGDGGLDGAGGAGVVGSGLTIDNTGGTITGGRSGDGVTQAYAVVFTGGDNSMTGGTTSGGIDVTAGSFAPALSTTAVGTPLAISGPLTFAGTSSYAVRLNGTASDRADVTTAVGLSDTAVTATFTGGSSILRQYDIMTAGLGFYGSFGDVTTNLPAWMEARVAASGENAYLDLSVDTAGQAQNQQNVGTALNDYLTDQGSLPAGFLNVSDLSQLDGEVATGAQVAGFQLSGEFLSLITGHGGSRPPANSGIGAAPLGYADESAQIAAANAAYVGLLAPGQSHGLWASAYGGASTSDGDVIAGSSNADTNSYGLALGMEGAMSARTVAGFALAGGGTHWSLASALGGGRSDAIQAGVYSRTEAGPTYLSLAGAFSNNWFSTHRAVAGDDITAAFAGQTYGARAEVGYRMRPIGGLAITPYVGGQWQTSTTPAYAESGGGAALSYAAKTATEVKSEIGAEFDATTDLAGKPILLFSRAAWTHRWGDAPSLDAVFTGSPGADFAVEGAATATDATLLSLGARATVNTRLTWQAEFNGAFGAGSQTYGGDATLRYQW